MDRGPRIPAFAVMADPANAGRTSLQRSDQRRVRKDHAETSAKGHLSGRGPRHAIFAGDQGHAEGDVDGVDKPLIQYAVEKALTAIIKQIILVTKRSKSALEDHFDKSPELEATMWARGKSPVASKASGCNLDRPSMFDNRNRLGSVTRYGAPARSSVTSRLLCSSPTN